MDRTKLERYFFGKRNPLWRESNVDLHDAIFEWKDDNGQGLDIRVLLSGRNRAKSYAVTAQCLMDAYYDGKEFAYVRRYDSDVRNHIVEKYFDGHREFIKKMTNGMYQSVKVNRGQIFLYDIDEKHNDKLIGQVMALNKQERWKSLQFPDLSRVIVEEFLSERYISNECVEFANLLSTLKRHKTEFIVYMIANTITRINPYADYFSWENFTLMKPGDRDIYKFETGISDSGYLNILVYYLEDADNKSATISARDVASNRWFERSNFPTMPHRNAKSRIVQDIPPVVLEHQNNKFLVRIIQLPKMWVDLGFAGNVSEFDGGDSEIYCYAERKIDDVQLGTRLYTTSYMLALRHMASRGFKSLFQIDNVYLKLMEQDKIIYCNNLTANEFKKVYNEIRLAKFD